MAKKRSLNNSVPGGRYRIMCNYAGEILCPAEAIEQRFFEEAQPNTDDEFVTLDGRVCRPVFQASWREIDEAKMDDICMARWGCKFTSMRSMWIDRLRSVGRFSAWHLIKLDIKE